MFRACRSTSVAVAVIGYHPDPSAFLSVLPISIACFKVTLLRWSPGRVHSKFIKAKYASSMTHVPAFWYRFCITVACRDSYACGYFTVSAFVCRSWALVVLGFRTCLVRMYIGHSSSSVSVHASFACISREMLMPRSHVSRGRT